jgi:hypothetical protein
LWHRSWSGNLWFLKAFSRISFMIRWKLYKWLSSEQNIMWQRWRTEHKWKMTGRNFKEYTRNYVTSEWRWCKKITIRAEPCFVDTFNSLATYIDSTLWWVTRTLSVLRWQLLFFTSTLWGSCVFLCVNVAYWRWWHLTVLVIITVQINRHHMQIIRFCFWRHLLNYASIVW